MNEVVSRSTSRQRFNMWLMTVFGGSALLLAAIGIYGLMAYSVEQRTQEIGIRLALGAPATSGEEHGRPPGHDARARRRRRRRGRRRSSWRASSSSFLFGVTPRDPLVFVAVPLVLSAVALLAVWLPARRASRIDPIIALRAE